MAGGIVTGVGPDKEQKPIGATVDGELKVIPTDRGPSVEALLLTLIREQRALRKVVCQASGQAFLDADQEG